MLVSRCLLGTRFDSLPDHHHHQHHHDSQTTPWLPAFWCCLKDVLLGMPSVSPHLTHWTETSGWMTIRGVVIPRNASVETIYSKRKLLLPIDCLDSWASAASTGEVGYLNGRPSRRHIIMGEHSFIELAGWLIGLFVGSPQLRCASLDDVMMWLSLGGWWYQLSIDCTGRTLWNEWLLILIDSR